MGLLTELDDLPDKGDSRRFWDQSIPPIQPAENNRYRRERQPPVVFEQVWVKFRPMSPAPVG